MTHEHTLRIEAARAGVAVEAYLGRLDSGMIYCWRCGDWHPAGEFAVEPRRHTGRAGACRRSVQAAAAGTLTAAGLVLPPAATWVVRRMAPAPGPPGRPACSYWYGPVRAPGGRGRRVPGPWSPVLDDQVARFPGSGEASRALISAFGRRAAVPAGCSLVRLA
jgi:hypothetical protein